MSRSGAGAGGEALEVDPAEVFCPFCHNLFVDPVILDCGDTICCGCASLMGAFSSVRGNSVSALTARITCPTCRKDTRVSTGGIGSLKKNARLAEATAEHMARATAKPTCAECSVADASSHCTQCASYFCETCVRAVHSAKVFASHKVQPAGDVPLPSRPRACVDHGKPCDVFCRKCEVLACEHCVRFGAHKDHATVPIPAQDEASRKELSADALRFTSFVERVSGGLATVRAHATEVQAKRAALLDKVSTTFAAIRRRINEKESEIERAVRDAVDEKHGTLEVQALHLADVKAGYTRLLGLAESALAANDPTRVLMTHIALRRAAAELSAFDVTVAPAASAHVEVKLDDSAIERSLAVLLESFKVDATKDAPAAAAGAGASSSSAAGAAGSASARGGAGAPSAAGAGASSSAAAAAGPSPPPNTNLPTLRPPTVRPTGDARVQLSWAPVLLPPEAVEAGMRVTYEVQVDGGRVIYSGADTALAVALPLPPPGAAMSSLAFAVRYLVGAQPSSWSPSVEVRLHRAPGSVGEAGLSVEVMPPGSSSSSGAGGAGGAASGGAGASGAGSSSAPAAAPGTPGGSGGAGSLSSLGPLGPVGSPSPAGSAGATASGAAESGPSSASAIAAAVASSAWVSAAAKPSGSARARMLRLLLWGAGGGGGGSDGGDNHGGSGGFVTAVYEAEVGERLRVTVGGGGRVSHFAPAGAPNGGGTFPSTAQGMVSAGGGGGSTHVQSGRHGNEVVLGAGGGGGGGGSHLYAGAVAPGGGGGGGTFEGRIGIGGQGAGPVPAQRATAGANGGGGGGACTLRHPGAPGGGYGGAGGDAGMAGVPSNGAAGGAHTRPDDGSDEGGRKGGGGGGGAASARHCIEGTFRAVTPKGREPIVLQGEDSRYAGAGGATGGAPGRDGRAVIIMPDGTRHVFETCGEYELVVA